MMNSGVTNEQHMTDDDDDDDDFFCLWCELVSLAALKLPNLNYK